MRPYTASEPSAPLDAPGACVRIGAQVIELVELPNPDPVGVDPSYNMSAPPPGYVAERRDATARACASSSKNSF